MNYQEIKKLKEAFEDVPGTYLFNSERCKAGYWLNMFCMSLQKPENRKAFNADEASYLAKYDMTDEQRQAVLDRDWLLMIQLGGNIYYTAKLAANDGRSFQFVAGEMTGMGQKAYRRMMVDGGRVLDGNRSRSENNGQIVVRSNG